MLQRMPASKAQTLGLHNSSRFHMLRDEENTLVIDLDLIIQDIGISNAEFSWRHFRGLCRGAYTSLYEMLKDDVECWSRLLSSLEDDYQSDSDCDDPMSNIPAPAGCDPLIANSSFPSFEKPPFRLSPKSSEDHEHPLIIRNSHSSIPIIVITPCIPDSEPSYCRVPIQDSAFNTHLVVPGYLSYNNIFPPMASQQPVPSPLIRRWKYKEGHWQAAIPSLEEQNRKGMFSSPLKTRRRSSCRKLKRI